MQGLTCGSAGSVELSSEYTCPVKDDNNNRIFEYYQTHRVDKMTGILSSAEAITQHS